MKLYLRTMLIILGLSMIAVCSGNAAERSAIRLMTHDSFSISQPVLAQFEQAVGAQVKLLKSGDAGEALNKAVLSKNNPLADLFYGVDNTFLSRALTADMFVPYAPEGLDRVPDNLKLDPENRLVPVDYGDVCINYDIAWFKKKRQTCPNPPGRSCFAGV